MSYNPKVDLVKGGYTKGRKKDIIFGVIHCANAKNVKGFSTKPYDMEGIRILFHTLGPKYKFSCHYVIDREGNIYQYLATTDTAWHAGKSIIAMPKVYTNINDISIGIELVGDPSTLYTIQQYTSLAQLASDLETTKSIKHWVGHDWVSGHLAVRLGIKTNRNMKKDPGHLFDWRKFLSLKESVSNNEIIKHKVAERLHEKIQKVKAPRSGWKRWCFWK